MNSWSFTGNLGKDAETRFTPNGDAITSFSVAVKAGYGKNEVTSWVNCSIFGKRGEGVSQYLTKGAQVGIVGEALLRPWTDKQGIEKHSLDCRVNDLTLLGTKSDARQPAATKSESNDPDEDIPF